MRTGLRSKFALDFARLNMAALDIEFRHPAPEATAEALAATGVPAGYAPVLAALLRRFESDIRPGDVILSPDAARKSVMVGVDEGAYYFEPNSDIPGLLHRRSVEWRVEMPLSELPKNLREAVSSPLALYRATPQQLLSEFFAGREFM